MERQSVFYHLPVLARSHRKTARVTKVHVYRRCTDAHFPTRTRSVRTSRAKGHFLMSSSVVRWYALISFKALSPGRKRLRLGASSPLPLPRGLLDSIDSLAEHIGVREIDNVMDRRARKDSLSKDCRFCGASMTGQTSSVQPKPPCIRVWCLWTRSTLLTFDRNIASRESHS